MMISDIKLPKLIKPEKDITLNKLIDFYNHAIKSTRILPIFIRNAKKKIKIWKKKQKIVFQY